jgi:glycosidase
MTAKPSPTPNTLSPTQAAAQAVTQAVAQAVAVLADERCTLIDLREGLIDVAIAEGEVATLHDASGRVIASSGQPAPVARTVRLHAGQHASDAVVRVQSAGAPPRVRAVRDISRGRDTAQIVPTWALGTTWYQIFPERFRNAVPSNDPQGPAVFLAEWRSDWYSVQPGELEAWQQRRAIDPKSFKPHREGALYNVIWDRRYGGDLQGVLEKLGEIKALGVDAIYFNPIFEAQSLHKYDASDFRHIDQRLANPAGVPTPPQDGKYVPVPSASGTPQTMDPKTWAWSPADRWFIDVFLPACKQAGIRVILDGVWNHTGREFWAFQDIVRNGRKSPYADWFICEFDDEGKLVGWSGWDGKNGWLPEFRQVKGGAARDRDATVEKGDLNAGIKRHIFDVTRRWMDPNNDGDPSDGIDGWRLDVAGEVGQEFWRDWRAEVKRINPQAITIAEIWSDASEWIAGGSFDTQMHYPFAFPVLDWLRAVDAQRAPVGSEQLARALDAAFADSPHTNLLHQNLFASHDTDRYVNMLWNPARHYDRDCAVQEGASNPRPNDPSYVPYKAGKPPQAIYDLSILGLALQATYMGSPMVYYGDEVGMWGADDPTCRKPYPWPDAPALKAGVPASKDALPIASVRSAYEQWLTLRRDPLVGPALRLGNVQHLPTQSPDVFAFARELNGVRVVVVVNRGEKAFDASSLTGAAPSDPGSTLEGVRAGVWHAGKRVR